MEIPILAIIGAGREHFPGADCRKTRYNGGHVAGPPRGSEIYGRGLDVAVHRERRP